MLSQISDIVNYQTFGINVFIENIHFFLEQKIIFTFFFKVIL